LIQHLAKQDLIGATERHNGCRHWLWDPVSGAPGPNPAPVRAPHGRRQGG
jgi:hypothetical protein